MRLRVCVLLALLGLAAAGCALQPRAAEPPGEVQVAPLPTAEPQPSPTPSPAGPTLTAPLLTSPSGPTPAVPRTPGPDYFRFVLTPSPTGPYQVAREIQVWPPQPEASFLDWSPDSEGLLVAVWNGRTIMAESPPATYRLNDIYRVRLDGSPPEKLIQDRSGARWSPDGRRLLFTRLLEGRRQEVYLANPDGSGPQKLAEGDLDPVRWMGNGRIAYAREGLLRYLDLATGHEVPAPPLEIWVPRGPGERHRTFLPSPDGGRLAYGDGPLLWLMGADGGRPTLVSDKLDPSNMAWSLDGSRLAYGAWRLWSEGGGTVPQLWVVDREGANALKLSEGGSSFYAWISCFPDGQTLLFAYWVGGGITPILLARADGGGLASSGVEPGLRPAVSPDGRKVVFERLMQGLWVAFLEARK